MMADGRSNGAIAKALFLSYGSVGKLRLPPSRSDHRWVLAVLRYLES